MSRSVFRPSKNTADVVFGIELEQRPQYTANCSGSPVLAVSPVTRYLSSRLEPSSGAARRSASPGVYASYASSMGPYRGALEGPRRISWVS